MFEIYTANSSSIRKCSTKLSLVHLSKILNLVQKNSTISLADKLKKCVPSMEVERADNLVICMQCSMHLETAYMFYMTCLATEEKLRKHNPRGTQNSLRIVEEEHEKSETSCQTCNVHFSSRNMLDLHIKLMHSSQENMSQENTKDNYARIELVNTNKDNGEEDSGDEPKRICRADRKRRRPDRLSIDDDKIRHSTRYKPKRFQDETGLNLSAKEFREGTPDSNKRKFMENKTTPSKSNKSCINGVENDASDINKTEVGNHRCRFCSKRFLKNWRLVQHMSVVHPGKCKACVFCKRYYTNKKLHKRQYGCQVQNLTEDKVGSLSIGWKITPDNVKIYYGIGNNRQLCLICGRKCKTIGELKKHLLSKHNTSIRCNICNKSFPSVQYCGHIARGCSELVAAQCFNYTSDGNCICPICNKVLSNRTTLRLHMVQHLQDSFRCGNCGFTYSKITSYCQHVVKGCSRKSLDNSVNKPISTFVKCDPDPRVVTDSEAVTSTQEDPLDAIMLESPTTNLILNNKSVKVEPTDILDQNGCSMGLDGESNLEYISLITVPNEMQEDTPELVYVVNSASKSKSEVCD
ncbi:hypothetical protein Trydic_g4750 [Trypoxylus dichotomus]